jgi:hypothetical protein
MPDLDVGADRAGPDVGSGMYCALTAVARQNPSANSINNALHAGALRLAVCDSIRSSAILGPFRLGRQIFKWRDKSYYRKVPLELLRMM